MSQSGDYVEGRLLDGFLLLAAGGSSSPDDVHTVNLSSLQIVDVAEEDLTFFTNLDRIDVSDNQLSHELVLEQLARLPRLGSLVLACNSLSSLQVPVGQFKRLNNLDLSFNELHGDVLAQLAHLPSLVTLNLSSNCISSVPPEEDLYGLTSLEELILDSNDLVQFIQWRSLDSLPSLRKLSLASNRVKRLKDDAPDTGTEDVACFRTLEELNLSSNEIVSYESLPVVRLFVSLKTLRLSDNPCTRGQKGEQQNDVEGVNVHSKESAPWFMKGNGCFQKREKTFEPKLRMNRKKMRRVRTSPHLLPGGKKSKPQQLGVLDEEANRLLVHFQGSISDLQASQVRAPPMAADAGSTPPSLAGLLGDDLDDEEELERRFREGREKIDRAFTTEVEEPESFMRPMSFQISAETGKKLDRLGNRKQRDEEKDEEEMLVKRPSSQLFLTSAEEGTEMSARSSGLAARDVREGRWTRPPVLAQSQSATNLSEKDSSRITSPSSPAPLVLPPIRAGSRGSSAGGGDAGGSGAGAGSANATMRSDPLLDAGRQRPVPDVSVREAMRALRAAAMSEYAVASVN